MREIVHIQAGQCGNQIGAKVKHRLYIYLVLSTCNLEMKGRCFSVVYTSKSHLSFGDLCWPMAGGVTWLKSPAHAMCISQPSELTCRLSSTCNNAGHVR